MADMVPHKVEPAKRIGRAAHDAAGEIVLAQIADDPDRPPARGGNLSDDRVDTGLVDVDNSNRCAFPGETDGSGATHP